MIEMNNGKLKHLMLGITLLISICIMVGCELKTTSNPSAKEGSESKTAASPNAKESSGTVYKISALKGSISVPDGYFLFSEEHPCTNQMCESIGITPENMKLKISTLDGQALIVPSNQSYLNSAKFYVKVKEKKYESITFSRLSKSDADLIASSVVGSFGVKDYKIVEGNGLRFFVFKYNIVGNNYRYATIINGHMIYVYADTGNNSITTSQISDLESIALSIKSGL